ncbi:MAG: hypothetical protein QOG23_1835 [Blastocatellia bacterium]|nr:hypothetical protein [Blastocatellia bacterium]
MECGDLSPLFEALTCQRSPGNSATWSASGDKSPLTKALTSQRTPKLLQLLAQPLIHNFGIRLPFRSFHHLADKESKQRFLA